MCLYPVEQGQLILRKLFQNFRLFVALTQLFFHLFYLCRDSFIPSVLVERFEQIQFGVFFDFNAQVVELLNRCVASQEI